MAVHLFWNEWRRWHIELYKSVYRHVYIPYTFGLRANRIVRYMPLWFGPLPLPALIYLYIIQWPPPPPPFAASRFSGGITFSTTSSAKTWKVYESYSYGWNILNFLSISIHRRKDEKKNGQSTNAFCFLPKRNSKKKRFFRTLVDEANSIQKSPSGCLAPAKTNFSLATKLVSSVWCWIASVQIQYCEWIGHQLPWTSIIPNLSLANTSSLRHQTPNTNFDPNSFAFLECGGTLCGHYAPCNLKWEDFRFEARAIRSRRG